MTLNQQTAECWHLRSTILLHHNFLPEQTIPNGLVYALHKLKRLSPWWEAINLANKERWNFTVYKLRNGVLCLISKWQEIVPVVVAMAATSLFLVAKLTMALQTKSKGWASPIFKHPFRFLPLALLGSLLNPQHNNCNHEDSQQWYLTTRLNLSY